MSNSRSKRKLIVGRFDREGLHQLQNVYIRLRLYTYIRLYTYVYTYYIPRFVSLCMQPMVFIQIAMSLYNLTW